MSLIKVYKGNPTAGGTDGDLISSGTGLSPIESGAVKVPTSGYTEGEWIKLALRCDAGYETVEDTSRHVRVEIVDSTAVTLWQLAPDNAGSAGTPSAWGALLDVTDQVGATNYLIWVRARAAHTEIPIKDVTVDVKATAFIGAE